MFGIAGAIVTVFYFSVRVETVFLLMAGTFAAGFERIESDEETDLMPFEVFFTIPEVEV
jgi:hypothetical protein